MALVWVIVVIIAAPLGLSLGKHFNYISISRAYLKHDSKSMMIHAMIMLALLSGVYYEAISSSANLQAKAFNAVDYKGNLATIMNSGNSVTADSGLSADIANAQMKLAQCEERLKAGKEKHCEGSKARVNALKEQSSASLEASANASSNAVTAKGDVLKEAVNDQALPASKWVAQMFGLSNDGGTMMIVIIAALFFELIHLTTVFSEIRSLKDREGLNSYLNAALNDYFKAQGKVYSEGDFKDERVIDLSKEPLRTNAEPEEIITPRFNYQDKPFEEKPSFGFVPQSAKRSNNASGKSSTHPPFSNGVNGLRSDRERIKSGEKVYPQAGLDERVNDYASMLKILKSQPENGVVECPICSKKFTKSCSTHRFCSVAHKTRYWNERRKYTT
jgi:hypothetical protein